MKPRTPLKVRHLDFRFGDEIPFHWNPDNVRWGNLVNLFTLVAPSFERYVIRAIREAIPRISDPALAKEADEFCRQEAQHSKHHQNHLRMLTKKHPGLVGVVDRVNASYEALLESETQEFHLAYSALMEMLFGPLAKHVIEQRECLFRGADRTISSFMLWHLIEEFEHRSSAFGVYDHVVGSYWFRMRCIPRVLRHLVELTEILNAGVDASAPRSADGIVPSAIGVFHEDMTLMDRLRFLANAASTLLPFHDPRKLAQPEWAAQWFRDEAAGVDMRAYYPPVSGGAA